MRVIKRIQPQLSVVLSVFLSNYGSRLHKSCFLIHESLL